MHHDVVMSSPLDAVIIVIDEFEMPLRTDEGGGVLYDFRGGLFQLAHFVKCKRTLLELKSKVGTIFKFKKRKKYSSSFVYVLDKA